MSERDEFRTALIVVTFIGASLLCFLGCMLYAILVHQASPVEVPPEPRFMGLPAAPSCGEELSHKEWAACMGVDYKERP